MPYAPRTERLLDRLAIQDCLSLNAHATDMLDAEAWKSTYWPDAEEDHGFFRGNAHAFVEQMVVNLRAQMDLCWHLLGNTLVTFDGDGDGARAATYFYSYCRMIGANGARDDSFCGGRYMDRFEMRAGVWRIAERVTKPDWIRNEDGSFPWGGEALPGFSPRLGMRDADDPARVLFGGVPTAAHL